jgi:hypothetical protein
MISSKGMDELFWGKDLKNVFDWAKRLWMVVEVCEHDIKFSKFQDLICVVKPRITSIGD